MTNSESRDEVTKALIARAREGDAEAKEQVVKDNLGLVWSVARRFARAGTVGAAGTNGAAELDDLFQIGSIGLIKCVEKFDLSYNVKFSTYAVPMIMGEIRRFLRDDGLIKVSRPLKETAKKARRIHEEMTKMNGRPPSIGEVAAALDLSPEDLTLAIESSREAESLYATVNTGSANDGSGVYLIDKIGAAEAGVDNTEKLALKEAIAALAERERQVIVMRYFQDRTQADVAERIGVSQVQVSRIEKRVLSRMREKLA